MWQELRISKGDRILNDIGCFMMWLSIAVTFWIATRYVSTQTRNMKKVKLTPPLPETFTGNRGVHQ